MNIGNNSIFNWTSPINRYNYTPRLFQKNQNGFIISDLQLSNNNYSNFSTQEVADDFADLAEKAQILNIKKAGNVFETTGATASSSNSGAVTAKAANGAVAGTYNLQVSQIAKAQENAGNWSDAGTKTLAMDGGSTITISVANDKGFVQKSANISVTTKSGQTNKEVLSQMADSINKKGQELGIQARVESRVVNGVEQARLVVVGTKTGTSAGTFSINDTTGTLAAGTGIKNVTTNGQNAKYSLNGIAYESQSNNIILDRRGQINATLAGTSKIGETVKINIKPQDAATIYNHVKDFVNQYNQTIRDLQSPENRSVASMNQNFGLTQINSTDRTKLSSMGITVNNDHTLSINESRFRTALSYEPDKVRDFLGGFTTKVADNAQKADIPTVSSDWNWTNGADYYPGKYFNFYL